jgi:uncharacterized membrane protein YgcG
MKTPEDLSELDVVQKAQEDGAVVLIRNADGISPLGFSVRVAGPDSIRGQTARSRMQDDFLALGTLSPTPEQRDEVETKMLSRVCIEFVSDRPVVLDKRPLQNTEEDFFRLMTRFRWIRRQIDNAQGQRARFLPLSALTSSSESSSQSEGSGSSSPEPASGSGASSGTSGG